MKAHLIQITVIALAIAGALVASPVAARPKDPNGFQRMPFSQRDCPQRTSFGDPPAVNCTPDTPEQASNQSASRRAAEGQSQLRDAANAVTSASSLQSTLDMQMMMTSIRDNSWSSQPHLAGNYVSLDRLVGILTIAHPWTTIRSPVIVASGEVYISHPPLRVLRAP